MRLGSLASAATRVIRAAPAWAAARPPTSWPLAVIGAVVISRAVAFAIAFLLGDISPLSGQRSFAAWISVLQMSVFAGPALVLLIWGRDRRVLCLGVYLLDVACTLAEPLIISHPDTGPTIRTLAALRADAFQASLIWYFAALFPNQAARPRLAAGFKAGFFAAVSLGIALVALDAYRQISGGATGASWLDVWAGMTARHSRGQRDVYFTLQYTAVLPLFVLVPLKFRYASLEDRGRLWLLMIGFAAAIVPIFLETALATMWSGYAVLRATVAGRLLRVVLFTLAIGTLPIFAAYAALIQRTLDVRLVVRTAVQYLLTRWLAYGLLASPLAVAVVVVFLSRERPVRELFAGGVGLTLVLVSAFGLGLLVWHERLLQAIDRRYFRQHVDAGATLLALGDALRHVSTLEDFSAELSAIVDRTYAPLRTVTAVLDEHGLLQAQDANVQPLSTNSALAQLIGSSDDPLLVDLAPSSPLGRLVESDRAWLTAVGAQLVVPLRGPQSDLLGVLALGERRGDLAYSQRDWRILSAIGSSGGLALARLREGRARAGLVAGSPEHVEPPARECVECGLVHHADAIACRCGAPLQRAAVPFQLSQRLRFARRIGAGGMGVVYEAFDLNLRQTRAVKALPFADPAHVARVRREARAMAAASHPNLATLYGMETWGSSPLLVMEYCEGGTLADRLQRGPLTVSRTLDVGMALADALTHLHEHRVLHRDVKPSNIGFTASQTPKLLDFGLAKLLQPVAVVPSADGHSTLSEELSTEGNVGIRGTPAYVSPEVLRGSAPSAQDDLWSLAITLLEACTGRNPFKASTPVATAALVLGDGGRLEETLAPLPDAVRVLFRHLLDRRPTDRPPSALAFSEQLQLVRQGVTHG